MSARQDNIEARRSPPAPEAFELLGPLPAPGVTMLEASAGTGKTFTIAALVTRYVAEGVPLERILAVTFTRMATAELRSRVRDRLVSAEEHLAQFLDAGVEPPDDDEVARHLLEGDRDIVVARRSRLYAAIGNFDSATITTTHGFCHLVLASLGTAGDVAPGAVLTENAGDTLDEVVEDLYVRWVLLRGRSFAFGTARTVAASAMANPDTRITEADADSEGALRVRLAERVREEVARRLLQDGLLTYDDLLVRLRAALRHPTRGAIACGLLRDMYSVVLVDEFQDTDPIQWEVVRTAFGSGTSTLVMIGDPKQAIYSFRGGDVYTYLDATDSADRRFTLTQNWRSDSCLLDAYDTLLEPIHLGHPEIPYRRVGTPESHRRAGIIGLPEPSPLRIRVVQEKGHPSLNRNRYGAAKQSAEEWIARDVAEDIVGVLSSQATITRNSPTGSPIEPGDIAVLVRTNRQAREIEAALLAAGVPAVMGSSETVFASEGARHWFTLLEALEQPASRGRAAALALTPLIGRSALELATMDESAWEQVHERIHSWTGILRKRSVASLWSAISSDGSLGERMLGRAEGGRCLTDLGHIAQLLHAECASGAQGPSTLRTWLGHRMRDHTDDNDIEERSRRLESDADAVQVLTVHRAKGLEFPIVYCPYLWDTGRSPREGEPIVYHERERTDPSESARRLDVSTDTQPALYKEHKQIASEEQSGEDLRLLYVALTRARHQAVLWWVATRDSARSPLARVLMRDPSDPDANVAHGLKAAAFEVRLADLEARSGGTIRVEPCREPAGLTLQPNAYEANVLDVARFTRSLDGAWRRSSYSSITAAAHWGESEPVGSEPEDPGTIDEPNMPAAAEGGPTEPDPDGDVLDTPCPMTAVPAGAQTGTFVHHVLERIDFAAPELSSEVAAAVEAEASRRPASVGDPGELEAGLIAAVETPLGPIAGDVRLRDIRREDRLDELSFELPVAGGEAPTGAVHTSDLAEMFARHTDPAGPLRGYADKLAAPVLQSELRGYLTGSLDLVFRTRPTDDSTYKYFVADYKTNRLAPAAEQLTVRQYRPEALDAEMQRAHYPLQAVLYTVALHRYLRWRMPGYKPEVNLGGVLYLFLRGMTGADCPVVDGTRCGVFAWVPPTSLVIGLSDLFDRGRSAG